MDTLKNNLNDYRNPIIYLTVCIIIICFSGIFGRDLWTPDEPRVAAIALEMSRNGDLVIPQLAGEPFIEKPPLYFAVAAGLIRLIGPFVGNTSAIRLASVFFALGTLWVTYLLAKRLTDTYIALLSTIILGTMVGFVENFHWIRVDTALSFFVVAAVYSFAEGIFADRPLFFPLAGLFMAGAFLSKGLIGPLLIFIPWAGLIAHLLMQLFKTPEKTSFFIFGHVSCFLVFTLVSGLWIVLLKTRGGPELWNEWFWVNHVGRLTGSATVKGHIHSGEPLYYLTTLAMYSTPWLPLIFIRFSTFLHKTIKTRTISRENVLLWSWGMGTILFLTLSATKRSIYLAPALPAFAVISAMIFRRDAGSIFKYYTNLWLIICSTILAILTGIPFIVRFTGEAVPAKMVDFLGTFGFSNFISGVGLIVCIYYILKKPWPNSNPFRFIIATFALYMGIIAGPMHAIDLEKQVKTKIQAFTSQIPEEQRLHVAGWNFSETMRANFYYYGNWSVLQINNKERLQDVLAGHDDEFDSIIFNEVTSVFDVIQLPHQLILETNLGSFKHRKNIFWVKGRNLPYDHKRKEK